MIRVSPRALAGLLVLWLAAPAAAAEADPHLRAGAAHFRAGRFAEAVVEFKVAQRLGAGNECLWYVAAALARGGRTVEALEAFEQAQELAPDSADALFHYYRGVACSDSQLIVCAADSFELASKASGPRVAEQATRLAGEARALLRAEPPAAAIDALLTRATAAGVEHPRLARVFSREALALASRRADHYREGEARRLAESTDAGRPPP